MHCATSLPCCPGSFWSLKCMWCDSWYIKVCLSPSVLMELSCSGNGNLWQAVPFQDPLPYITLGIWAATTRLVLNVKHFPMKTLTPLSLWLLNKPLRGRRIGDQRKKAFYYSMFVRGRHFSQPHFLQCLWLLLCCYCKSVCLPPPLQQPPHLMLPHSTTNPPSHFLNIELVDYMGQAILQSAI